MQASKQASKQAGKQANKAYMRERTVVLSPTQPSLDASNSQPSESIDGRTACLAESSLLPGALYFPVAIVLLLTSCRAFLYDAASTAADKNSASLGTTYIYIW